MWKRLGWYGVAATATAACLLMGACSRSGSSGRASGLNLLVITLDTTRADALGLYGNPDGVTPNLDRLGRDGVVFDACVTPAPLTLPAHCSLFTGLYPIAHKVRNNGTYVLGPGEPTLAEAFKARGYRTAAFIASFILTSKFGLGRGFDTYEEDLETGQAITDNNAEIPADRVYERFARWLDGGTDGNAFFCWVHFYDAHAPYVRHAGFPDEAAPSQRRLYEGEVHYVDAYVGRIVEALKAKGLFENTVVVVAGDHGEGFGEHKENGHGIFCYEESLRVPLVFHNPRVFAKPVRVSTRVSLVDVAPTVLKLFRLGVAGQAQGTDLAPLMGGDRRVPSRPVYFESMFGREEFHWAPLTGLIDGGRKYISLPEPELYDLEKDGREGNNLAGAEPETARAMDKALAEFVRTHAATGAASRRNLTPADVEKLKSLGYVSAFTSKSGQAMDPKRGMDVYLETAACRILLEQGKASEAEARLSAILGRNPGLELPDFYEISYRLAKNAGKTPEEIAILRKAVAAFPELESFKMNLAMALIDAGDLAKAEEFCRELIAENESRTGAQVLLGNVERRLGKLDACLAAYEKAAALEPRNGIIEAKIAGALAEKGEVEKAGEILGKLEARRDVAGSAEFAAAVSALGSGLMAAGKTDRALDLYARQAAANPHSPSAWIDLGSTYFRLRQYDRALESYDKALAIDANSALALSNSGIVYLARSGDQNDSRLADKALGLFDRAVRLQPGLASAWSGRASARLVLNQAGAAVKDYEEALRLDPGLADAYVNLSIALRELGRYDEALKVLDAYKEKFRSTLTPAGIDEIDGLAAKIKARRGR